MLKLLQEIEIVKIVSTGSTRMISELRYYSKMSCDAGKMNSPIQINECMSMILLE